MLQIIISSLRQCFRRSINNKKCFLSLIRRTLVLATTRTEICTQHCHQPQYLDLTLQYTQAVISVPHVQVFVQVSCPVHQHGVGNLGVGRGPQVPMLRPGGPGWSLHRVQAQRQQRPQRPPGGQPPLPQGLGPRSRVFRKQSHKVKHSTASEGFR